MNLMAGAWQGDVVRIGDATAGGEPMATAEAPGAKSTVGVRPGDLRIADSGLPARVERVEDLGDSAIVSFVAGGNLLKQKTDRLPLAQEGDATSTVSFAAGGGAHLRPANGARLEAGTSEPAKERTTE